MLVYNHVSIPMKLTTNFIKNTSVFSVKAKNMKSGILTILVSLWSIIIFHFPIGRRRGKNCK